MGWEGILGSVLEGGATGVGKQLDKDWDQERRLEYEDYRSKIEEARAMRLMEAQSRAAEALEINRATGPIGQAKIAGATNAATAQLDWEASPDVKGKKAGIITDAYDADRALKNNPKRIEEDSVAQKLRDKDKLTDVGPGHQLYGRDPVTGKPVLLYNNENYRKGDGQGKDNSRSKAYTDDLNELQKDVDRDHAHVNSLQEKKLTGEYDEKKVAAIDAEIAKYGPKGEVTQQRAMQRYKLEIKHGDRTPESEVDKISDVLTDQDALVTQLNKAATVSEAWATKLAAEIGKRPELMAQIKQGEEKKEGAKSTAIAGAYSDPSRGNDLPPVPKSKTSPSAQATDPALAQVDRETELLSQGKIKEYSPQVQETLKSMKTSGDEAMKQGDADYLKTEQKRQIDQGRRSTFTAFPLKETDEGGILNGQAPDKSGSIDLLQKAAPATAPIADSTTPATDSPEAAQEAPRSAKKAELAQEMTQKTINSLGESEARTYFKELYPYLSPAQVEMFRTKLRRDVASTRRP